MPRKDRIKAVRVLVVGPQLLEILTRTVSEIKMLGFGNSLLGKLKPSQATAIVRKGVYGQYVGETTPSLKRIYFLREFKVDFRPESLWIPNPEFWNERAILRYAPDRRSIPTKIKNKEVEDMWDRMLKLNPAPKSWTR